jgi:hypothetical protein
MFKKILLTALLLTVPIWVFATDFGNVNVKGTLSVVPLVSCPNVQTGTDGSMSCNTTSYFTVAQGSTKLNLDQTSSQTITGGQPIQNTLTASQLVATDANKKFQTLAVASYPSLTELSYAKGVTSAIQTQINGKQASLGNFTSHYLLFGQGTSTPKTSSSLQAETTGGGARNGNYFVWRGLTSTNSRVSFEDSDSAAYPMVDIWSDPAQAGLQIGSSKSYGAYGNAMIRVGSDGIGLYGQSGYGQSIALDSSTVSISGNLYVNGSSYSGSGGGEGYDQSLNTWDNPSFLGLLITYVNGIVMYYGGVQPADYTQANPNQGTIAYDYWNNNKPVYYNGSCWYYFDGYGCAP